jgi:hypothetical protein
MNPIKKKTEFSGIEPDYRGDKTLKFKAINIKPLIITFIKRGVKHI